MPKDAATVPSGKLWEYVVARRPILATVPVDGVAARIVRALGAGIVVHPDDPEAISAAIEVLVDRWLAGGIPDLAYPRTPSSASLAGAAPSRSMGATARRFRTHAADGTARLRVIPRRNSLPGSMGHAARTPPTPQRVRESEAEGRRSMIRDHHVEERGNT